MGLQEKNGGAGAIYCRIANGKIVVNSHANDGGAVRRINKTGREVWERFYDELSGFLIGVRLKEGDYQGAPTKDWHFIFQDGANKYVLQTQYDSSYAKRLINALASIEDFSKKICVSTWKIDENKSNAGKAIAGASVYYGETARKENRVPERYKREDMPAMKETTVKGRVLYDDTELCAFLENVVNTEIMPRLAAASSEARFEALFEPILEDELPF